MRFTDSQRHRLHFAVLVSLLAHTGLLALVFSGPGLGTPGLGLNWRDRQPESPGVRVVMVPARPTATPPPAGSPLSPPPPQSITAQTATVEPGPLPPAPMPAAAPPMPTAPSPLANAEPKAPAEAAVAPLSPPAAAAGEQLATLTGGAAAPARPPAADKIALDTRPQAAWTLPAELPQATAAIAPAASASSAERALPAPRAGNAHLLARIAPLAREQAVDLSQLDRSAQEAKRQIEQLQASSAEAVRLDLEREQAARQLAALQEAARAETARQEAERQDAARQAATRQEAARALAAQADADTARREASRRAMGRQLDEEAAQRREAASAAAAIVVQPTGSAALRQAAPLPLSWSSARRGRLLGRADPNAELVAYAEAWARKIQLNLGFDQVREVAQQRHTAPLVTVALRQDGSVESVTFVVSSGVPQIDEAIRRIVQGQAPYPAFSPALARDFDVVEIRRTWTFDTAVRLH